MRSDAPVRPFKDWKLGLLVAVAAFLVYANSLANGFVWDDAGVIVNKPALYGDVLSLFAMHDSVLDKDPSPYYRPFTYVTFMAEERLHGLNPFWMHLLNVLLHAGNAFLVFLIARSLLGSPHAACLAGLLFAVHPINAESVNFLSGGRNTLLACFFVLIALLLHARSVRRNSMSDAVAGAVAVFAGLLSKELAIAVLPFVFAIESPALYRGTPSERRRAVMRLAPYLALTAAYFALRTFALLSVGPSKYPVPDLGTRLLNNIYIIPRYLFIIVWPRSLSMNYEMPENLHLLALPLAAAWFCIAGLLVWVLTRKDRRVTLFGLAWATAFWLPVSGLIAFPSAPLAERYLYLPAIGIWLMVAEQTERTFTSPATIRRAAVFACLLIALATRTVARNADWKNNLTLFARYVEQNPDNAFGHQALGATYLENERDNDSAEREYVRALELDPSLANLYNPLGSMRLEKGDLEGALSYFTEALAALPVDQDARFKRARVYEELGRPREALMDYQKALAIPGEYGEPGSRSHAEERVRELSRKHSRSRE